MGFSMVGVVIIVIKKKWLSRDEQIEEVVDVFFDLIGSKVFFQFVSEDVDVGIY